MNKSKLLAVYRSIEPEEWKPLLDFVASPYFNKDKAALRLCKYLQRCSKKDFPAQALRAEKVWTSLFPKLPFNKKELAYLMSSLLKVTERFLGQQAWEASAGQEARYTLAALSQRKLHKSYRRLLAQQQEELAQTEQEDQAYFLRVIELAQIQNQYFSQQNQRVFNPHLQAYQDALDAYYQLSKMSVFCDMRNQVRILGSDYRMTWPTPPSELPNLQTVQPLQAVYRRLFELLNKTEADDLLFQQHNESLVQLARKVAPTELINLYYFSINYCLYEINRGNRKYADALIDIYQAGLKNGNLLIDGELSPWNFKNMVKLGLGLRQFNWVQEVIENYSYQLPAAQRKDAYAFNMADLAYHRKDYDEAQALLNQVDFKDVFYKHGAKIMLLKIYYEKQETEAFFALVTSYRIMLLRDQSLSVNVKAAYANFNRLVAKLYAILRRDERAILLFEQQLQRTKNTSERSWLMKRLGEKRA